MQVNWLVLHPASLYEIKSDETRGYADGERREVLSADKLKLYDRARPSGNDTRVPTMVGMGRRGLAAKDARHHPAAGNHAVTFDNPIVTKPRFRFSAH